MKKKTSMGWFKGWILFVAMAFGIQNTDIDSFSIKEVGNNGKSVYAEELTDVDTVWQLIREKVKAHEKEFSISVENRLPSEILNMEEILPNDCLENEFKEISRIACAESVDINDGGYLYVFYVMYADDEKDMERFEKMPQKVEKRISKGNKNKGEWIGT